MKYIIEIQMFIKLFQINGLEMKFFNTFYFGEILFIQYQSVMNLIFSEIVYVKI